MSGRGIEKYAEAPSFTFLHDSLIYPFVSLFHSLFLYVPSISVHSNLSIYLYYPPFPLPLQLPFCLLLFLGLFTLGQATDDHTAVFQALIHGGAWVTVQNLCSEVAILWESNTTVWYAPFTANWLWWSIDSTIESLKWSNDYDSS